MRASWRLEAEAKASRRREDCDSMYWRDRVALDSREVRRLWMDLKKDSWVAGGVEVGGLLEVDEEVEEAEDKGVDAIGETDRGVEDDGFDDDGTAVDDELEEDFAAIDVVFETGETPCIVSGVLVVVLVELVFRCVTTSLVINTVVLYTDEVVLIDFETFWASSSISEVGVVL